MLTGTDRSLSAASTAARRTWQAWSLTALVLAVLCAHSTPLAPAAETPTLSPTAPPSAASRATAVYRVRAGAEIDLGWTGIAHDQPWPAEQRLRFDLDCTAAGACALGGGAPGEIFGAPVPLSSGGIPVCVVNRLREPLGGSVNAASGCGEIRVKLVSSVFTAGNVARPCPACRGDAAPTDGRKDGRCEGGASSGALCDANAVSPLFGSSSNDCLPARTASVGDLTVDLLPMTTGAARLEAMADCKRKQPGPSGRCFCAAQAQANECASGSCGEGETCDGPFDGVCSEAPFRSCTLGSGDRECGAAFPGTGSCVLRTRRCFGNSILAQGACDPAMPTYVAVFCASATQAPAVNSTAGLPGPARLLLPLERVAPHDAGAAHDGSTKGPSGVLSKPGVTQRSTRSKLHSQSRSW